jgi:hypothetical protein
VEREKNEEEEKEKQEIMIKREESSTKLNQSKQCLFELHSRIQRESTVSGIDFERAFTIDLCSIPLLILHSCIFFFLFPTVVAEVDFH